MLVRELYGFPVPQTDDLSWQTWVDLAIAAKAFLQPDLRAIAVDSFVDVALLMTDVDKIVDMIGIVEKRVDDELHNAATLIRQHHYMLLLKHEGYYATYLRNPKLVDLHTRDLLARLAEGGERA